MKRRYLAIAPVLVLGGLFTWSQVDRQAPLEDGPKIVASLGDSITRAFNPDRSSAFKEEVEYSWSTGTEPYIRSHVDRLRSLGADIDEVHNNALSGARSADLRRQMRQAIKQNADYVTIQIGSNDLCAVDGPSVEQFRENVRAALAKYAKQMPQGRIFLTSTPDLYRLWEVLKGNVNAQTIWSTFRICPSMLTSRNDAQREATIEKQKAYNDTLRDLCAEFPQCRFDDYAVFRNDFTKTDVSNVDYFHPSIDGQRRLAEITWRAGFWSDVPEKRQ
jgi:lysophospholipase L1-like esterase